MFSGKSRSGLGARAVTVRIGIVALATLIVTHITASSAWATGNRRADLEVTKTDLPDPVIAGQNLIYQLVVRNHGPNEAEEVRLVDELPHGVEFVSVEAAGPESPQCWYDSGDHKVTCDLDDLEEDAQSYVTIVVHVPANAVAHAECGTKIIENEAHVWAHDGPHDPDDANNSAYTTTVVTEEADLRIFKMSKPDDEILAGVPFRYTIIAENLGPSYARRVTIRDELLSNEDFQILDVILDPNQSDSGPFYVPNPEGGVTIEFDLNGPFETVGIETKGRWVIQLEVVASETSDLNNLVRIFSHDKECQPTPDPDESNNVALDEISIIDTCDLRIEKTALGVVTNPETCASMETADATTAGSVIQYDLFIENRVPPIGEPGGSTATNVVIQDSLPVGLTVLSISAVDQGGNPVSCNTGTPGDPLDPATCNIGTLDPGAMASMQIVAAVDVNYVHLNKLPGGNTALLHNNARVFSDKFDPDTSDNLALNISTVTADADLTVYKEDVPDEVVAGESLTYALIVLNNGPSTGEQVGLFDQLPSAVSFVSAAVLGGEGGETCTYGEGAHSVACSLGEIEPGDLRVVHIEVLVDSDAPDEITNLAAVASLTGDCNFGNNADTTTTDVIHKADLSISKSGDPDPVLAGELLLYTVTVTNHGPSVASEVNFTDTLPGEVAYMDDDSSCLALANTVSCSLGDLNVGESKSVDILVLVSADAVEETELGGKTITNVAVATSETMDPNEANNTDNEETFVTDAADLCVTKLSLPDQNVNAGEEFRYIIFVENLGPSSARGVRITDDLLSSGDFTLVEIIEDPDRDDTCSVTEAMSAVIECTLGEPLEPVGVGGTGRWRVEIVVTANEPQDVQNIVRAYTTGNDEEEGDLGLGYLWLNGTPDPNEANNQAIDFIAVDAVSDLAIDKSDDVEEDVGAGDDVTYTLAVTNHGPSNAVNVVVEDFLPADVQVVSIVASQGSCGGGTPGDPSDPATCNLGDIASGGMATVTIVVRLDDDIDSVLLVNTASVSSDNFDDDNSNNIDHTIIQVEGVRYADLAIFKTGKPDRVVPAGQELTYTIIVDNLGPDPAENVVIDEVILSDGMFELVSVTSDRPADCDPTSGMFDQHLELTCELGDPLEPIDTEGNGRWTVVVVVVATEGVSINNDAFVHSDTPDPNLSNNRALTTHDVQELADLAITKSDSPDPVGIGHELTYLLTVTNNGPSTASNVVVEDVLPARLIPVEVTPSQGACVIGTPGDPADPLSCNLGTLNVGASATVTIVALVGGGECDVHPIFNNAKTYSDHPDPNNGDNVVNVVTQLKDGEPPIITCPAPIVVISPQGSSLPPTTPEIAEFLEGASAIDNCDPDVDITHDGPALFPLGETLVTFTATDDDGNTAMCSSTVTVVEPAPQSQPAGPEETPSNPVQDVVNALTGGSGGGLCGVSMTQTLAMSVFGLLAFSLHARGQRRRR